MAERYHKGRLPQRLIPMGLVGPGGHDQLGCQCVKLVLGINSGLSKEALMHL